MEYVIAETLGVLSEKNERTIEVNIISWNKNDPKLDIRRWSSDHSWMGKGIALDNDEAKKLYEILKARYE